MNMKDAFRFQNKLQTLMGTAQDILSSSRNITKVENTYLRKKVMPEAEDEVTVDQPTSEYSEQITCVAEFLLNNLFESGKCYRIEEAMEHINFAKAEISLWMIIDEVPDGRIKKCTQLSMITIEARHLLLQKK